MSSWERDLFSSAVVADQEEAALASAAEQAALARAEAEARTAQARVTAPARRRPAPSTSGPRVWTVAEVNRTARDLLEQSLARLWVAGEVANFSRHRAGHCYFTLKDADAQISCTLFRREAARLPMLPHDGMTVRIFGRLTLYVERGRYQLIAAKVEAESEGGMWKLAFDRLRKRLDAEGLTAAARKRPLPPFPRAVGVVTSPGSAALRDIVAVVGRRAPWVRLVVRGARVQGEGAAREVAAAVASLGTTDVDVIVVARGGGSVEDLWAFNKEAVARAVAASPVPVVSGVGHETDVTICDLVADVRAATPSAAAEAVVPERKAVERRLNDNARRLSKALARVARARRNRLEWAEEAVHRGVRRLVPARRERLERAHVAMTAAVHRCVRHDDARLAEASAKLDALSPLATLARGYAVPLDNKGNLLRGAADFVPELEFQLRVVDGNVPCRATGAPRA